MTILSINAGSSSLKFALYGVNQGQLGSALLIGQFEHLEPSTGSSDKKPITLKYEPQGQQKVKKEISVAPYLDPFDAAIEELKTLIAAHKGPFADAGANLVAIAHRVVHGGAHFSVSTFVTDDVLNKLRELNSLAPLHQPHNIAGIEAFQKSFPEVPQVACFDTSFHTTLPVLETTFAIPNELTKSGVRRYGFHGLSYQYVSDQLSRKCLASSGRTILAHLGNGASLCATLNHKSVSTTMGFSALDGLMMGTRSGAIDAGVLLYLLSQGKSEKEIETLLYKQSGLLGVSGFSADVRTLRQSKDPKAIFALDLFAYRITKEMGALSAVLGGLDVICFTGGIGEHDRVLRSAVCRNLSWLGIELDEELNNNATGDKITCINSTQSRVQVWVVPTDEGKVASQQALMLV